MDFTTRNYTTSTRPRVAGKSAVTTEKTDIIVNGEVVETITWGVALLRRLDRLGLTREEYVAKLAGIIA